MSDENIMPFDFPQSSNIIKVIGVGGGGGNAVNHMFREGIHDVTFVVCNTDHQALEESPVPVKIQLGHEGLGAGNRPERAREAAKESLDDIKNMLSDGCKMVFITAGMGGGTGTGAPTHCPRRPNGHGPATLTGWVIGHHPLPPSRAVKKIDQALDGVEQMSKHVDALLVINDERLRDVYSDVSVMNAFGKADDTLSIAAKSIAEIITIRGKINLDFRDVETVVKDGGVAIMSTGYGSGENRLSHAINDALHSPLLNNNDVFNSKKILFNITYSPKKELMMEEMNELHEFMSKFSNEVETKWGLYEDEALDDKVKFTVLATGFGIEDVPGMDKVKIRNTIEEEEKIRQQEELALQKEERRVGFYGSDRMGSRNRKKRHNIYVLDLEELDNDDVISVLDTTPTFSRTKSVVENLQASSKVREEEAEQEDTPTPGADNGNTILF